MNLIDAVILVIAITGFILGFKDGFIRKLIGLIGLAVAILCTAVLARRFGTLLENVFQIELYLSEIIGGVLIFFVIIIIFTIIKRVVHPFDKINSLINQLVGGVVGMIQIFYFLSAVLLILNIFEIPSSDAKSNSLFYESTSQIIPVTINYLSAYTPEPRQIIKEYIERKDSL